MYGYDTTTTTYPTKVVAIGDPWKPWAIGIGTKESDQNYYGDTYGKHWEPLGHAYAANGGTGSKYMIY